MRAWQGLFEQATSTIESTRIRTRCDFFNFLQPNPDKPENTKFEYRNPKQCANFQSSNDQNVRNHIPERTQCIEHLEIRVLNLFAAHALKTVRISDFEFRILYMAKTFLPEKTRIP